MKLINKKTGEIAELIGMFHNDGRTFYRFKDEKGIFKQEVHSLLDLSEWWEDYEEPKEYWFISDRYKVFHTEDTSFIDKERKSLGNYFETKEEAEKAVEKLKAWKRLKDKGFKFIGVRGIGKVIDFDIPEPFNHVGFDEYVAGVREKEFYNDLLLLFGGEE